MKNMRSRGFRLSLIALLPVLAGLVLTGGCSKPEQPATQVPSGEQASQDGTVNPPGVVAMVDDRPITREDVDRRAGITVRVNGGKETDPDYDQKVRMARRGAVDLLVQAYVMQSAATESVQISTREIETELLTWKMRVPDKAGWDAFLQGNKMTEDQFREVLIKDLRIRKQMEKAAQREVPAPSPEEIQHFYDVNTLAFSWPYRVRYDSIEWIAPETLPAASREQAKKGMEALAGELSRNPALFDEILGREVSRSISYWGYRGIKQPFVTVKDLPPPISEALQSLVQGEVSPVIETPQGYLLLRIASLSQSFESAYKEIGESIYTEKCRLNLNEWMKRQKQKHKIRVIDSEYYLGDVASSTAEATAVPQRGEP